MTYTCSTWPAHRGGTVWCVRQYHASQQQQLSERPRGFKQVVQGPGPGARYAHVLALVGQRFLLVLGGNDGYKVRRLR